MQPVSQKKILAIGNRPEWRQAAKLAIQPYDIQWTQSGEEALHLLRTNRDSVHALISDTELPDLRAKELLKWVRQHREGIPVVVMPSQESDPELFLELGALSVVPINDSGRVFNLLQLYFALA